MVGATVQGAERNLLLMATKAYHLLILVQGGAHAGATEAEIREAPRGAALSRERGKDAGLARGPQLAPRRGRQHVLRRPSRRALARAFPPEFDDVLPERHRGSALTASTPELQAVTGPVGVLDLRYRDARVVIRPAGDGALLVVLCDKTANAQEVLAFASVACKKFERLQNPGA